MTKAMLKSKVALCCFFCFIGASIAVRRRMEDLAKEEKAPIVTRMEERIGSRPGVLDTVIAAAVYPLLESAQPFFTE